MSLRNSNLIKLKGDDVALVVSHLCFLFLLHFSWKDFPDADSLLPLCLGVMWRPARFVVLPKKIRLIDGFLKILAARDKVSRDLEMP